MKLNTKILDDDGKDSLWLFGKPYSIYWERERYLNIELEVNSIAEICLIMVTQ
jgi:hypothetical protein